MAISVTHQFVSAIPDGGDTSVVQPSDWNATHTLAGLGTGVETALGVNVGSAGAFTTNNAANTFTASQTFNAATSSIYLGANSGNLGVMTLYGSTSGSVTVKPAAAAGTGTVFQLPADNGTNGYVLQTNGSGVTSWVASGASAPLTLASGTITDSSPALAITQTWNDAADTFVALDVNVTSTASATASKVLDLRVASSTVFSVRKDGRVSIASDAGLAWPFQTLTALNSSSGWTAVLKFDGDGTNATVCANGTAGAFVANFDTSILRLSAGVWGVRGSSSSAGAAMNFLEQTAPSAPSANEVVIYAEDNGSGKTRLMARFNTGAAQQIAIEP